MGGKHDDIDAEQLVAARLVKWGGGALGYAVRSVAILQHPAADHIAYTTFARIYRRWLFLQRHGPSKHKGTGQYGRICPYDRLFADSQV